ncbi:hypothetical protein SLS56_008776, partial [Neofusicoccum ribis]
VNSLRNLFPLLVLIQKLIPQVSPSLLNQPCPLLIPRLDRDFEGLEHTNHTWFIAVDINLDFIPKLILRLGRVERPKPTRNSKEKIPFG